MYYDRQIPQKLLDLLAPDGALAWLSRYALSERGAASNLHIQFRRDQRGRRHGCIHAYFGRTSPLQIEGRGNENVNISADSTYQDICPDIFSNDVTVVDLNSLAEDLETHLTLAAEEAAPDSFLLGEAVVHGGLMRRYGPSYRAEDPFVAIDSEARIGFDSISHRKDFHAVVRTTLGIAEREAMPMKLDTIGFLPDGQIALIEIKDLGGDLARALTQVAAHVYAFRQLAAESDGKLIKSLAGMASQKASVGLMGAWQGLQYPDSSSIVPVVAAPSDTADWINDWRAVAANMSGVAAELLASLRFWRLSASGEILEDVPFAR